MALPKHSGWTVERIVPLLAGPWWARACCSAANTHPNGGG